MQINFVLAAPLPLLRFGGLTRYYTDSLLPNPRTGGAIWKVCAWHGFAEGCISTSLSIVDRPLTEPPITLPRAQGNLPEDERLLTAKVRVEDVVELLRLLDERPVSALALAAIVLAITPSIVGTLMSSSLGTIVNRELFSVSPRCFDAGVDDPAQLIVLVGDVAQS